MEIKFYKDTLTARQIIDLAWLDYNFKFSDEENIIIEFKERHSGFDQWHGDSGSIDVFADIKAVKNRSESNYLRLFPYVKFNQQQLELFKKFIYEKFEIIECPYYIVCDESQQKLVEELFNRSIQKIYKFPFIIGKEPGFVFQNKDTHKTIDDCIVYSESKIYKYVHKNLEPKTMSEKNTTPNKIEFEKPVMPVLGFGGGFDALNKSMQYTIYMLAEKLKEMSNSGNLSWSDSDVEKIEKMKHYMLNDVSLKDLSKK